MAGLQRFGKQGTILQVSSTLPPASTSSGDRWFGRRRFLCANPPRNRLFPRNLGDLLSTRHKPASEEIPPWIVLLA